MVDPSVAVDAAAAAVAAVVVVIGIVPVADDDGGDDDDEGDPAVGDHDEGAGDAHHREWMLFS